MDVGLNILVLIILYSTLAITGLAGNIWVLFTVSSQLIGCSSPSTRGRAAKPNIQSSAYIYLLLLSIVDLTSLIPVPMLVTDLQENRFIFGVALCKLLWFSEGANKTLSPMILTALSIDRYIAVCKPTLVWMRQTKFAIFVVSICIMASLIFIIPITVHAYITDDMKDAKGADHRKCILDENTLFDGLHTLACYVIPLLLICSVYLVILLKLYRHTRLSTVGRKTSISLSRVVKCSVMVVAFYFICWTPYWTMRIQYLLALYRESSRHGENNSEVLNRVVNATTDGYEQPMIEEGTRPIAGPTVFLLYLMHALPYAQSAFNWLFYAFLNRNLRNSSSRCSNGFRSAPMTSTVIENGPSSASGLTPLWKNLQQVGSQIKTAGIGTGNALLKMSPFRTGSRIQSRSSTYLDTTFLDGIVPLTNPMSSSLLDLQRRSSVLVPRQEPSLVGKALSFSNLPHKHLAKDKEETPSSISDSSSVEWL